jgi:hypothetical protein
MPDNHDLQPLLDTQQNQLSLVFSDSNGIDAKALAVLGANVAALLFIDASKLQLAVWQFFVLYGPFVLSLLLDILATWPREYLSAINQPNDVNEYLSMDAETLVLQLLADTQTAIRRNTQLNTQRLRFCIASIIATGLGFLTLLAIL